MIYTRSARLNGTAIEEQRESLARDDGGHCRNSTSSALVVEGLRLASAALLDALEGVVSVRPGWRGRRRLLVVTHLVLFS